jgi:hypothetical protein
MDSKEVQEGGKTFRILKLYCKTAGCPKNNGQPVMTDKVEEQGNGNK